MADSGEAAARAAILRQGKAFRSRLNRFYTNWKENRSTLWHAADSVTIVCGKATELLTYKKTSAITLWLWGYEVIDTVLVFTEKTLYVVTGSSKAKVLGPISEAVAANAGEPTVEFVVRARGQDADAERAQLRAVLDHTKESFDGRCVGALVKGLRHETGPMVAAWNQVVEQAGYEQVEIGKAIARLLAVKDETEQKMMRTAASITQAVMKNFFVTKLEEVIGSEKKVTHESIADYIDGLLSDPRKISRKLSAETVDACYAPIVQSGGDYNLRPSARSKATTLHYGTIVCSVGSRYKCYCSNVARTLFVNPTDEQKDVYAVVLALRQHVLDMFKPGVKLSAVYQSATDFLKEKSPGLEESLVDNLGFGVGLEFRERQLLISADNHIVAESGMTFNLSVGLENLSNPNAKNDKGKVYAILLADTVQLTDEGAKLLTNNDVSWKGIAYTLETDEVELVDKDLEVLEETSTSLREQSKQQRQKEIQKNMAEEQERREKQQQLAEQLRVRALAKLEGREDPDAISAKAAERQMVVSYKSGPSSFPHEARPGRLFVDMNRETILLPVYGMHVPLHITTLKSITKNPELGELRLNFIAPTHMQRSTTSTGAQKQLSVVEKAVKANGNRIFLREATYKCSDEHHLNHVLQQVSDLRKRVRERELLRKQSQGLVKQDKLVLAKDRRENPRLTGVMIRPAIGGRKSTGSLEAHANGFRFTSVKGQTVDILCNNIRHAFFQPAKKSLLVLIHFHLVAPILIGKKRTQDVQFYNEVMEVSRNLDNKATSHWDADETQEEERERRLRQRLNRSYQEFSKHCRDSLPIQMDVPYFELGFNGVPHLIRNNVLLLPTLNCLVHLEEAPFFVLTLADVQICCFERVDFNLRNFDAVFVLNDLAKAPISVTAIPMQHLENMKEWLNSADVKYYELARSLNWASVLQLIRKDIKAFWEDGGWAFLDNQADEEDEEDSDDEPQSSDYEPPSSDFEASDSDSSDFEDEDEESDYMDSDAGDESDDGEDWEELERKAKRADAKKSFGDSVGGRRRRDDYSDEDDDEDAGYRSKKRGRR